MSLLACRLRLLKNIFLLRMCISSIVMSSEATLVPMIELEKDQKVRLLDLSREDKWDDDGPGSCLQKKISNL